MNEESMENKEELTIKDFKRLEEKLDKVINYSLSIEDINLNQRNEKQKKEKQKRNRYNIKKILYSIPDLEKFVNTSNLNEKELQDITDSYISNVIMGDKNLIAAQTVSSYRKDIKEKIKTQLFLNRIYEILDTYLAKNNECKLGMVNITEEENEKLRVKKIILRRVYGYKLEKGEAKVKSREELAQTLDSEKKTMYAQRTLYNYENELLDDLAPSFFGIDGLIL